MLADAYDRADLISALFRETDRAQRMKTPLSLISFCIVELDQINHQFSAAACDDAIRQISERTTRLLRSYDLLGRLAFNELFLALPGCDSFNAATLAERLRIHVFAAPFHAAQQQIPLSACFGIASSNGRSPIVVLREAQRAMQSAEAKGPGSIHCSSACSETAGQAGQHLILTPHDPAMSSQQTPQTHRSK
jgi:two-component system, cell cycle response regulator